MTCRPQNLIPQIACFAVALQFDGINGKTKGFKLHDFVR